MKAPADYMVLIISGPSLSYELSICAFLAKDGRLEAEKNCVRLSYDLYIEQVLKGTYLLWHSVRLFKIALN